MWITFAIGVAIGVFFAAGLSNENFRRSPLVFGLAVAIFCGVCLYWATQWRSAIAEYNAVIFFLCSAFLGFIWCFYFSRAIAERLGDSVANLVYGGRGGSFTKDYSRAVALEVAGKHQEAIAVYHQYALEDPRDYVVWERTARCHFHLHDPHGAGEFLQKAIVLLLEAKTHAQNRKQDKREETARLLFLQRQIYERFQLPIDEIQDTLCHEFANTRFGLAAANPDPLALTYLEVWSDCQHNQQ